MSKKNNIHLANNLIHFRSVLHNHYIITWKILHSLLYGNTMNMFALYMDFTSSFSRNTLNMFLVQSRTPTNSYPYFFNKCGSFICWLCLCSPSKTIEAAGYLVPSYEWEVSKVNVGKNILTNVSSLCRKDLMCFSWEQPHLSVLLNPHRLTNVAQFQGEINRLSHCNFLSQRNCHTNKNEFIFCAKFIQILQQVLRLPSRLYQRTSRWNWTVQSVFDAQTTSADSCWCDYLKTKSSPPDFTYELYSSD